MKLKKKQTKRKGRQVRKRRKCNERDKKKHYVNNDTRSSYLMAVCTIGKTKNGKKSKDTHALGNKERLL